MFRYALLVVSLVPLSFVASFARAADAEPVRVMSFNLRYGTAKDGENHWDKRKELLLETVKAFNPDLLGTQETLGFQRDFLHEKLDGYEKFGVGRDAGDEKGEMTAVLFRKARFEKVDGGHFWLSEQPDKPGSKSWDTSLTRMCTWVKLKDLKHPDAGPIYFFNTHFDHIGQQARVESAKLIRDRIAKLGDKALIVLTGDFNAAEGSGPYKALTEKSDAGESPVVDTFRVAHPTRGENEGTFTGFKDKPGEGRIDWILCSRQWTIVEAGIDRTQKNGRWPSDHFPVTAVLKLK